MGTHILEFMEESKTVDRWFILKVAIAGGFSGALLTVTIMLVGFSG